MGYWVISASVRGQIVPLKSPVTMPVTDLSTVPFIGENYSVYPFGSITPSATIVQPGGLATLSPDATRMGFRLRADDAFYVAATILVSGGEPVRVQGMRPTARATPEYLLWRR